jgi:hypothetical protein
MSDRCQKKTESSTEWSMTRRDALRVFAGAGLAAAGLASEAHAYVGEFWDQKQPSDWTEDELKRLTSRSPWAKEASIDNKAAVGPLSTRTPATRRSPGNPNGLSQIPECLGKWDATVRWDSALPVRQALGTKMSVDLSENYIINVFGEIPSAAPNKDDSRDEIKTKFDILQERTRIERKGDPLELKRVELAPKTWYSPPGTLFYFSRAIPIMPEDKQVTFVTRIGPLEVKCRFILKDMMYRGNLEL